MDKFQPSKNTIPKKINFGAILKKNPAQNPVNIY